MEVLVSREGGVLRIALNRPEKKNSITAAMYRAFAEALADARQDSEVRVVLITGTPEVFTAGNDLADFRDNPPQDQNAPVFAFLTQIRECEKPMVAAVCGAAVGVGTTLLLHCDLVYVAETARFAVPFTSLGLVPEAASSYLLPLIAGYQQAAELLLLGEPFDAARAKQAGFVTQVLPPDQVFAAAQAAAAKLAALPPTSVQATRALLKGAHAAQVARQMHDENERFRVMLTGPAAREAFAAFFAKRKPDFSKLE